MYFDVWIAQKITQNAENHIFEVPDFQIFLRRIDHPPPAMCDLSDMHRSEKSLDPRLVQIMGVEGCYTPPAPPVKNKYHLKVGLKIIPHILLDLIKKHTDINIPYLSQFTFYTQSVLLISFISLRFKLTKKSYSK